MSVHIYVSDNAEEFQTFSSRTRKQESFQFRLQLADIIIYLLQLSNLPAKHFGYTVVLKII